MMARVGAILAPYIVLLVRKQVSLFLESLAALPYETKEG